MSRRVRRRVRTTPGAQDAGACDTRSEDCGALFNEYAAMLERRRGPGRPQGSGMRGSKRRALESMAAADAANEPTLPSSTQPLAAGDSASSVRAETDRALCWATGLPYSIANCLPAARRDPSIGLEDFPEGGVQRVVHMLLELTRAVAKVVAPAHQEAFLALLRRELPRGNATSHAGDEQVSAFESSPFVKFCAEAIVASPKLSVSSRVLYAVLCSCCRSGVAEAALKEAARSAGKPAPSFYEALFAGARRDGAALCTGEFEEMKRKGTRRKFNEEVAREAVKFLLQHIQPLSWGTADAVVDGATITLPEMVRKGTAKHLSMLYTQSSLTPKLSAPSFLNIVNALTQKETARQTCVNYVEAEYCIATFALLRDLVARDVHSENERARLSTLLHAVYSFMRREYAKHVCLSGECASHSRMYALAPTSPSEAVSVARLSLTCKSCLSCFFVLDEIKKAGVSEEGERILRDSATRIAFYMAHTVRVEHQRAAISSSLKDMTPVDAHIIIDWKMKFPPVKYTETSVDHFGKRGLSWHGCAAYVGSYCDTPTFYDTIMENDNMQDTFSTVCALEAVLWAMKRDFPQVESVTIQCDNAPCYQCDAMVIALSLLRPLCGQRIKRVLHTETQDGKSIVDAHFSVARRYVDAYVNEGNDVAVPAQLAHALSRSPLTNTRIMLLRVDSARRDCFRDLLQNERILFGLRKSDKIGRANEIVFEENGSVRLFGHSGFLSKVLHRNEKASSTPLVEHAINDDRDCACQNEFDLAVLQEEHESLLPQPSADERQSDVSGIDTSADDQSAASPPRRRDNPDENNIDNERLCEDEASSVLPLTGTMIVSRSNLRRRSGRWTSQSPEKESASLIQTGKDDRVTVADADGGNTHNLRCDNCGREFTKPKWLAKHSCPGAAQAKDLVSFAIRELVALRNAGALPVRTPDAVLDTDLPTVPDGYRPPIVFCRGWARHDSWAVGPPEQAVLDFKEAVLALYEKERRSEGTLLSGEQVLFLLKKKFANRLLFPGPSELVSFQKTTCVAATQQERKLVDLG